MLAVKTWGPKIGSWCTLVIPVLREAGTQGQEASSGSTEQTALLPVSDPHLQKTTRTKRWTAHEKRHEVNFMCMCTATETF